MAAPPFEVRRRHERVSVTGPATLSGEGRSLAATIKDISIGGLFLFTDAPFRAGAKVDIVLVMPKELGLQGKQMVCCRGTVVRVERSSGQYGIAAEIEHIADMPHADSATSS